MSILVNFHQWSDIAILVHQFLFSLSPLSKGELQTKSMPNFRVLQSVHIRMGQQSKNKTVFKLPVEATLVISRVSKQCISLSILLFNIGALCLLLQVNSQSARKHFTIQLLWEIARLQLQLLVPCQFFVSAISQPPPSDPHSSERDGVIQCVWSVCR